MCAYACVSQFTMCVQSTQSSEELELQVVLSHLLEAGIQILAVCKSRMQSPSHSK